MVFLVGVESAGTRKDWKEYLDKIYIKEHQLALYF